jgi:hypothetical protein
MFLVRSQVRHTGFELTQTDDARLLAPQITRFENTQPLAYHPRRSPAEFPYQNCKPLARSVVQPGLNSESHALIVLQDAICMTYRNSYFAADRQPALTSNLADRKCSLAFCRRVLRPMQNVGRGVFQLRLMISTLLSSIRSCSPIWRRPSSFFTAYSSRALQISLAGWR